MWTNIKIYYINFIHKVHTETIQNRSLVNNTESSIGKRDMLVNQKKTMITQNQNQKNKQVNHLLIREEKEVGRT